MSLADRFRWRLILVAALAASIVGTRAAVAGSAKSTSRPAGGGAPPAAVLETYVKPDGQSYFALKLTACVAQPPRRPHDLGR